MSNARRRSCRRRQDSDDLVLALGRRIRSGRISDLYRCREDVVVHFVSLVGFDPGQAQIATQAVRERLTDRGRLAMKTEELGVYGYLRQLCLASALTAGLSIAAGVSPGAAQASVDPDAITGNPEIVSQLSAFDTSIAYVVQFSPLWFTHYQTQLASFTRKNLVDLTGFLPSTTTWWRSTSTPSTPAATSILRPGR